jgi:hypothetical protein
MTPDERHEALAFAYTAAVRLALLQVNPGDQVSGFGVQAVPEAN